MELHSFPYSDVNFSYDPGPFRDLAGSDLGRALWTFLIQPQVLHAMVVAVRLGAAPVAAISVDLLAAFGNGDAAIPARKQLEQGLGERFPVEVNTSLDQVKRLTGHMIRQILQALGCVLRTKNSPANDRTGVFSTSARYDFTDGGSPQ
jgi:hypothetical protein